VNGLSQELMPRFPWPAEVVERMACSFALIAIVDLSFLAVLHASSRLRRLLLGVAIALLCATPLLVPDGFDGARAISVFLCFDAIFRLVDADRRAAGDPATRAGFLDDLRFFVPFPVLLVTGEERAASAQVTSPVGPAVIRAAVGIALFLAAWATLFALSQSEMQRASFVVDHIVKAALFAVTLEIIGLVASGVERLAGFETAPLMRRILLSRTPAEFWLRYNTRVHMWLIRNVFRRAGAARHPVRGVVIVFFVSALFHEIAFDIALSRVDGYQLVFFLLQIPAVLASPALERFSKRGLPARLFAHAITMAWFVSTSFFFFRGIAQIFPFYYTAPMPGPVFGEWQF